MRKILFLFTLFGIVASVQGQTSGQVATYTAGVGSATDGLYNYAMGSITDKSTKATYVDKSIDGSPYASNFFNNTSIYYGDELTGTLYYRYNAYNEEIEIKQQNVEGEAIRALGKDKKIKVIVDGKPMSFKTFIDNKGNTQNGYLTLLKDGKFKLYKRLNVIFKEAKKAPSSFVKGTPARFSQFTEYYLESEDGKRINEIEFNNKKMLNLFDSKHKESLKTFFSDNKLKIKTEQDLIKVISYLNK